MVSFVCVHVHSFKNPATSPLTFFFLLSVPVSPFAEGMANCTFLAAVNNATSVQCGADNADEVCCTKHPDPGPINCFDGDPSATAEPGGDGEENQYYYHNNITGTYMCIQDLDPSIPNANSTVSGYEDPVGAGSAGMAPKC